MHTMKWLNASMGPKMSAQVVFLRKHLRTLSTLERPIFFMKTTVSFQITFPCKRSGALLALIGLFCRMDSFVLFKMSFLIETLIATSTSKLLSRMSLLMLEEKRFFLEVFPAMITL